VVTRFSGSFPALARIPDSEVIRTITELPIFFIMLLGGLEMRPRDLVQSSGRALPVALGGILVPLAAGFALGWLFIPASPARVAQSLFIGVALSITAVPVTVKVLMHLGRLGSPVGTLIVSSALFDDVLSLVLLAVLTAIAENGSLPGAGALALLGAKIALFFGVAYGLGTWLLPRIGRLARRLHAQYIELSTLLTWALAMAVLAEALGMHFVFGAFVAGLLFTRHSMDRDVFDHVRDQIEGLTVGFFAPVFFATIGMHLDLAAVTEIPLFLGLILTAAFAGKFLGAGGIARAAGMPLRESVAVGAGMNARGALELIVADIALNAGLFDRPEPVPDSVRYLYSAVIVVAGGTTLVSPMMLRRTLREDDT